MIKLLFFILPGYFSGESKCTINLDTVFRVPFIKSIPNYRAHYINNKKIIFGYIKCSKNFILVEENKEDQKESRILFIKRKHISNCLLEQQLSRKIGKNILYYFIPKLIAKEITNDTINFVSEKSDLETFINLNFAEFLTSLYENKLISINLCCKLYEAFSVRNDLSDSLNNNRIFYFFLDRQGIVLSFFVDLIKILSDHNTTSPDCIKKFLFEKAKIYTELNDNDPLIFLCYMLIDLKNMFSICKNNNAKFIVYDLNFYRSEVTGTLATEIQLKFSGIGVKDITEIRIKDDNENVIYAIDKAIYANSILLYLENSNLTSLNSKVLTINITGKGLRIEENILLQ